MDAVTRLLQGSIDLHIHPSPSLFPRRIDAVEAAQQAAQAGMRAIVIKSHHHTTAPELVPLKAHDLKDIPLQVFGGVVLNSYVGGLNPYIVDMTLRLGGKIVWFPTISSVNHIKHHEAQPHMKFPSQVGRELPDIPVKVLDDKGELLPQARVILELIAEADAILSSGHVSVPEALALLRAAKEVGVRRMLINHPDFVIDASEQDVQEFVRLGAYIEHSMCMYHPESTFHFWNFDRLKRWIELVGPERTLLGSDLGQKNNPLPVEGLRYTVEKLLDIGIKEHEIEFMIKKNAEALLGLEEAAEQRFSTPERATAARPGDPGLPARKGALPMSAKTEQKSSGRAYNWNKIPSEVVRAGISRKGFKWKDMMMVMNECHPGMKLNPHSHTFEQMAYIVSGRAIYHVGETGHEVGPGSFLVIPAGVTHYIEPLGTEPVMNLDFFLPAREDYMHLVKYLEEEK